MRQIWIHTYTAISVLMVYLSISLLLETEIYAQPDEPISIGDRRELFLDYYLIDQLENLSLQLHSPRDEGAVLSFDKPWEGNFSAYCTVIKDGTLFRLYYRGVREAGKDGNEGEMTCYAESEDGVHWRKTDLGIYQINGSSNNNVILAHASPVTHNFSPFLDQNPEAKASERYKALGGTKESGLFAFVSSDGVHWKRKQDSPVFTTGVFDSQNVSFWSEEEQIYVCYFRTWSDGDFSEYKGFRSVSRTTSKDFIHWTPPVHMTFGNTPLEHLYTNQTSPYFRAPHIYVSIGARFMPGRQVLTDEQAMELGVDPKYFKDCSDAVLMSTRGGSIYDRTFMESFLRPGIGLKNWVSRSNYPVLNIVRTGPEEMSLYVNEDYAQPTAHIKRYSLRLDGFASLRGDYRGGYMETKPFTFTGDELEINYSTSAAGSVKIEVQDSTGKPYPGYSMDEARTMIGNEISGVVSWTGNRDVSPLEGKIVKLKIYLKDADLYSLKFNKIQE